MNNIPEARSSQEFSKESEKFLSPEELKRGLIEIEEFAEQAGAEWNARLCFPEGVKIGDEDLSGQPIAEVIERIRRLIDDQNYEPPVVPAEEGDTMDNPEQQEQMEEVPV